MEIKSLTELLQEFAWGKYLLGDLDSLNVDTSVKDRIHRFYNNKYNVPFEPNTADEIRLIAQLAHYIGSFAKMDVDMLNQLLKIKSKAPALLEPSVDSGYVYRGMTIPINVAIKHVQKSEFPYASKEGKIKVESKVDRGFLSFSANRTTAESFTTKKVNNIDALVDRKLIPTICRVKVSDVQKKLLFTPELMNAIGNMDEDEVLYVGNSFTCNRFEWSAAVISSIKEEITSADPEYIKFLQILGA